MARSSLADVRAADRLGCTLRSLVDAVEKGSPPAHGEATYGATLERALGALRGDLALPRRRWLSLAADLRAAKRGTIARLAALAQEARQQMPDAYAKVISSEDTFAARLAASSCLLSAVQALTDCAAVLRKWAGTVGDLPSRSAQGKAKGILVALLQAEAARVEGLVPEATVDEVIKFLAEETGEELPPLQEEDAADDTAADGDSDGSGGDDGSESADTDSGDDDGSASADGDSGGVGGDGSESGNGDSGDDEGSDPMTFLGDLADVITDRYREYVFALYPLREAPLPGDDPDATQQRSGRIGRALVAAKNAAVAGIRRVIEDCARAQAAASGQDRTAYAGRAFSAAAEVMAAYAAAHRAVAAEWGLSAAFQQGAGSDAQRALLEALESEAAYLGSILRARPNTTAQEQAQDPPPPQDGRSLACAASNAMYHAFWSGDAAAGQEAVARLMGLWRGALPELAPSSADSDGPEAAADGEAWREFSAPLSPEQAWELYGSTWAAGGADGALEVVRDTEGLFDALGIVALAAPARGAPTAAGGRTGLPAAALLFGVGLGQPYSCDAAANAEELQAAADAKRRLALKAAPILIDALVCRVDAAAVGAGDMMPRVGAFAGIAEALEGFVGRVPSWCAPDCAGGFAAAFAGAFGAQGKPPPDESVHALASQLRLDSAAAIAAPGCVPEDRNLLIEFLDCASRAVGRSEARIEGAAESARARKAEDATYEIGLALRAATRFIATRLPETRRASGWRCDGDPRAAAPTQARPTAYGETATDVVVIGWGEPLPDACAGAAADALAAAAGPGFPRITLEPAAAAAADEAPAGALVAFCGGAAAAKRGAFAGQPPSSGSGSGEEEAEEEAEEEEAEEEAKEDVPQPTAAADAAESAAEAPAEVWPVEEVAEAAAPEGQEGEEEGEDGGGAEAAEAPAGFEPAVSGAVVEQGAPSRSRRRGRGGRRGGGWALLRAGRALAKGVAAAFGRKPR
ncbi:hypothetical protein Rsub_05150 [Raphidocelis subcapitata]|uniref:Uncharacterized protein n=1 Tax=Raphidocelis subcapitata TaxID=307507 RepID=A0A2V0NY39_9CHLO|nr:hypothetical protein Rsub_05150 [Raphidocelis subcapitata]|eukprot:GBF92536.1 hypothetical protein Rsub_05150 [Raphidocelis subcapitata]